MLGGDEILFTCIKRFICGSAFLFTIFILLQVVSVVAIEYTYFEFREGAIERAVYSKGVASFSLVPGGNLVLSDITDIIRRIEENSELKILTCYLSLNGDGENETRAYLFGQDQIVTFGNEISFVQDAVISGTLSVEKGVNIGDEVDIGGKRYTVCGVRSGNYTEIPYQSLQNETGISSINITMQAIPSKGEITSISLWLSGLLPGGFIIEPSKRDMSSEYAFDMKTLLVAAVFFLVVFNISYLFHFVTEKRKLYYAVYMSCGASALRMKTELFAESFIYCVISFTIGTLVFRYGLVDMLFDNPRFSTNDFIIAGLICLIFSIAPVIAASVQFSTRSIRELICKGEM